MNLQRPYVVVKAACSLDGKIALKNGQSQWITGPQAREQGHRLRADLGAVLVGANTVRKDNPKLSARIDGVVNQPRRIVLDPKGSLGKDYEVFKSNPPGLRVVGEGLAAGENDLAVSVQSGVLDLHEMIRALWDRGLTSLLVEGGGITIGHFFEAGLVDRLEMFVAPIVIGDGLPWISGVEHSSLEQAFGMTIEDTRMIGPDLWITSTSNRAT
jgi:diaminohydroxyphosphoribosylaminopyrimidine deaminase/5-amino-6-(5-phosphoribosylamino)uracil reductase